MKRRHRGVGTPCAAAFVIAAAVLAAQSGCRQAFDAEAAIAEIEARYGVPIVYEMQPGFLPHQWLGPPADGAVEPIGQRQLARILRRLPDWLDKYPQSILRENLQAIMLCGRLEFYGVLYAGTSSDSAVYLVNDATESGFTDEFLEKTFHHEFSSLLMYRHTFPIQTWMDESPAGFEYLADWEDVLEEVAARRSLDGSPALFRQGLLAEYGRTNLENDVNTYVEVTFAEPQRMRQLVQQYPAIRAKYRVLRSYYIGLDPQFETWFQQIG